MKLVILAAGRGERMGDLTKNIPKSLLQINGRSIINYILSAIPSSMNDVIIVVNYLSDAIRDAIGNQFKHMNISYVEQSMTGTAGALWSAKDYLEDESFLVLNSDDLYDPDSLNEIISFPLSFGLSNSLPPNKNYIDIEVDREGYISGSHKIMGDLDKPILLATGAYVLDKSIFSYE